MSKENPLEAVIGKEALTKRKKSSRNLALLSGIGITIALGIMAYKHSPPKQYLSLSGPVFGVYYGATEYHRAKQELHKRYRS